MDNKRKIAAAIFVVAILGYTVTKTFEYSDSPLYLAEIMMDVQEIIDDADTTVMSVTGINKHNLQAADHEWEQIYKYADEFEGK